MCTALEPLEPLELDQTSNFFKITMSWRIPSSTLPPPSSALHLHPHSRVFGAPAITFPSRNLSSLLFIGWELPWDPRPDLDQTKNFILFLLFFLFFFSCPLLPPFFLLFFQGKSKRSFCSKYWTKFIKNDHITALLIKFTSSKRFFFWGGGSYDQPGLARSHSQIRKNK